MWRLRHLTGDRVSASFTQVHLFTYRVVFSPDPLGIPAFEPERAPPRGRRMLPVTVETLPFVGARSPGRCRFGGWVGLGVGLAAVSHIPVFVRRMRTIAVAASHEASAAHALKVAPPPAPSAEWDATGSVGSTNNALPAMDVNGLTDYLPGMHSGLGVPDLEETCHVSRVSSRLNKTRAPDERDVLRERGGLQGLLDVCGAGVLLGFITKVAVSRDVEHLKMGCRHRDGHLGIGLLGARDEFVDHATKSIKLLFGRDAVVREWEPTLCALDRVDPQRR